MFIEFKGGWFKAHDAFDHREHLKQYGFMYTGPPHHVWQTRSWSRAMKFKKFFSTSVWHEVNKVSFQKDDKKYFINKSLKKLYKKLDRSQREGVRFCLSRNHSYLNFEPGVGKTPTAIMVLNLLCYNYPDEHKGCVITVPPTILTQWQREIKTWGAFNYSLQVVTKKNQCIDFSHNIILVADSLLSYKCKVVEQLQDCSTSLMVIDEAHRFQNIGTKRTDRLLAPTNQPGTGIVHNADKVIYLSGTAVRRSPMSLYSTIQAGSWNRVRFMPYIRFGIYYCDGYEKQIGAKRVWDFSGASNIQEFKKRIKPFLLFKKLQLKTKTKKRLVTLDISKKSKEFSKLDKHFRTHYSFDDMPEDIGEIATYRKQLGDVITPHAIEYILEEFLKDDKKFLIVAWYTDVIEALQEKLSKKYNTAVIYGSTPRKKRDKVIDSFQSGKLKAVIAQVKTMIGLNMQAGSRIIFVESSFAWDDNFQAIRRLERRGQTKDILVDYLAIANSYQMHVIDTSLKKEQMKEKIVN